MCWFTIDGAISMAENNLATVVAFAAAVCAGLAYGSSREGLLRRKPASLLGTLPGCRWLSDSAAGVREFGALGDGLVVAAVEPAVREENLARRVGAPARLAEILLRERQIHVELRE